MSERMQFRSAMIWAGMSGTLALAWEIVWSRFYHFASASRAEAFGAMLGSYLLGLAAGALWSRRWQTKPGAGEVRIQIARLTALANVAAFLTCPIASWLVTMAPWLWTLPLVLISGGLLGIVFPMVCHWSIPADERAGERLSYLYVANIIGSGFGSLFTGFGLMQWFGIASISFLLLAAGLVWAESMVGWRLDWRCRGAGILVALGTPLWFAGFYPRLQYQRDYQWGMRLERVIESRHGVITVDTNKAVFGNGAYDGVVSTRIEPGSWMMRPYFISAVHPSPKGILEIGMSSGAWTRILASHPDVENVTAIEISSAYLDLIRDLAEVSPILNDPKVEIIIDDGRRWLRRNPERKFDLIVMNTSHHWREFASSVLSYEFLQLVKSHLRPGGLVMWNGTGSGRAARTGMEVFPHTIMVMNNCIGGESPIQIDPDRWRAVLSRYQIGGNPVFDLQTVEGRRNLEGVLEFLDYQGDQPDGSYWRWLSREQMQAKWSGEPLITDDNLGHEYPRLF